MAGSSLILLGSARKRSDTAAFLEKVFAGHDYELLDLLDIPIAPYNYSGTYPESDGFLKVVDALLKHQVLVFATPVYWYAMSGLMKTFFDRFTDLVTTKKYLGRQLRGKSTFLLAVGADEELPDGFETPFRLTSDYLDMHYQDCIYHSTKFQEDGEQLQERIRVFVDKVESANP